jgi:hypothetical protein
MVNNITVPEGTGASIQIFYITVCFYVIIIPNEKLSNK